VLAVIALGAGCSSSSSSTSAAGGSSPISSGSSAAGGMSISGTAAPGTDIGLTSTTIRIAAIDDVDTSVEPGLFQRNVNAVQAWVAMVNAHGGLAGRKVVVDFCDLDTCENGAGQPIGIPNLAAFGFPPYSCAVIHPCHPA
jgi:hypothetical protein